MNEWLEKKLNERETLSNSVDYLFFVFFVILLIKTKSKVFERIKLTELTIIFVLRFLTHKAL